MNKRTVTPHDCSIGHFDSAKVSWGVYLLSLVAMVFTHGIVQFLVIVVAPLFLTMLEKDSDFVRFNLRQSMWIGIIATVIGVVVTIVQTGLVFAAFFTFLLSLPFAWLVGILHWVNVLWASVFFGLGAYHSYHYEEVELPVIGRLARRG